jgi:hypothetical protein
MNFIETAWADPKTFMADTSKFMVDNIGNLDPNKVFLDVHKYIAWNMGNNKEFAINPDISIIQRYLDDFRIWQCERLKFAKDRYRLATTEFSAAYTHYSGLAIPDTWLIQHIYDETLKNTQCIEMWFWSWKIPGGMEHIPFWSHKTIIDTAYLHPQ